MIGRFFYWLFKVPSQEIHVHVHIDMKNNDNVVHSNNITPKVYHSTTPKETPIITKKEEKQTIKKNGPSSKEMSEIILSAGIDKAVDKSGNSSVSVSSGNNVNSQIDALKRLNK